MFAEPLPENLVDELTRLVGRPMPVVQEALARLLTVIVEQCDQSAVGELAPFPLTAWQALAPDHPAARSLWSAVMSAGLTTEEVFTTLAVVDDHVRRRFGSDAWGGAADWGHRLIRQYGFDASPRRAPGGARVDAAAGANAGA